MPKVVIWLAAADILVVAAMLGFLCYQYYYPEICEYSYIDKDGNSGKSDICGDNNVGGKYCKKDVKSGIQVISYEYKCERRFVR